MNNFEAGKPINTDDTMNDVPSFADRVRENIPEALEYLEQHPELKQGLGRATAKLEELSKMMEEGGLEDAEAANSTFVSSVEAFNSAVRANEAAENKLDSLETSKLDGQISEAEYKQAVEETQNAFANADDKLVEANANLEYADAEKAIEAAKSKMSNLEMAKDEVQISDDEYKTGMAEAQQELAAAEARAQEAKAVITSNEVDMDAIKAEADKKLEGLEIQKLDGQLSEEEYKAAVAEINDNTAKTEANVEASNAVADAVRERKVAEGKIALAEKALDNLDTQHLDGQISEDEFKSETARLNAIIEESKKAIEGANEAVNNSGFNAADAPNPAKQAQSEAATPAPEPAKELTEAEQIEKDKSSVASAKDEAALKEWREKQDRLKATIDKNYNDYAADIRAKARAKAEARISALENQLMHADPENAATLVLAISEAKKNLDADTEKYAADELAALDKYYQHKLGNDRNHEGTLGGPEDPVDKDGKKIPTEKENEQQIEEELKNLQVRRGDEVKQMTAKEAEGEGDDRSNKKPGFFGKIFNELTEEVDDDFETEDQKNLFTKLKGFFGRNKRSKEGAERASKKLGIKARVAAWVAILLTVSGVAWNMYNDMNGGRYNQTPAPTAVETQAEDENTLSNGLSTEVDINDEKGEELSDLINTTSYGHDIEVNIGNGGYSGETSFLDYEAKKGKFNLTAPLYDIDNAAELTNEQKAEQIAEGLAQVLDDPIMIGQFAALSGKDVVIDDDFNGITSFADMELVQDRARQDDEFRISGGDFDKEKYSGMVENHDLQVEHINMGDDYYSIWAYEDSQGNINYHDFTEVESDMEFDVLQFYDEDGNMILDTNEIGGYKYNFFKVIGYITDDMTDDQAIEVMKKYRIIGFSGKCGQLIWQDHNPSAGDEGTPSAGNETTPSAGNETTPSAGNETTPSAGNETTPSAGNETTPSAGNETTPSAGNELAGKTEETVASPDWDQMDVTDYDSATRGETVVTEQDTGRTDDQGAGNSSDQSDNGFLNGGDQGGGNTDADGGGSTNQDTEATYDNNTSAYDNGASQEQGTQTITESNQNSDQAADGSRTDTTPDQGDNNAPSDAEKADMMNDMF